jgi:hypothetical protein
MNEDQRRNAPSDADSTADKRPWHTPAFEEVDYVETEAAGAPYYPDAPNYGS